MCIAQKKFSVIGGKCIAYTEQFGAAWYLEDTKN